VAFSLTPGLRENQYPTATIELLKNLAVNSAILGLLWRATGWPLPTPVHLFVDLFARAAAPNALFCVGTS
jgi:predicted permease